MMQDKFDQNSARLLDLGKNLKLAVVIATYNREKSLKSLLYSLKNEMRESDFIIVADASDLTLNDSLNLDSRFSILINRSNGITQNRNIGLHHLHTLNYDYWCFLDDDVIIAPGYFDSVRSVLTTIGNDTAITGTLDLGLIPKLPNWLGYYRRNALTQDGYLKMPHSIGVWIPRISNKFFYQSKFKYGYDELELKHYIFTNNLRIQFLPDLVVHTDKAVVSSAEYHSKLALHQARISQNYKFKYSIHSYLTRRVFFVYRAIFHLALKGDTESRSWSRNMLMNPIQLIKWLNSHQSTSK